MWIKENYKGYSIEVYEDLDCSNPQTDHDCFGTVVQWHKRLTFGNKNINNGYEAQEAMDASYKRKDITLPIYMYEHSGYTISTTNTEYPFNDEWDAGLVGFVYIERDKLRKELSIKRITPKAVKTAENILRVEVATLDLYLRGECYGFILKKGDEEIDSCWGFYGEDPALDEARGLVDYLIKKEGAACTTSK